MNKNRKHLTHDFHLVLNDELKKKIIDLAEQLNFNISKTVIYILEKTLCILKKYHYQYEEIIEISKYQKLNWDVDLHICLDKDFYRKIKHLSDTVFAFSIAIIIRKLLKYYFYLLDISKNNVKRVEKILKRFYLIYVKEYKNKIKVWKKDIKKRQLSGEFYYLLEFNDKFSVTGIKFINSM